MAMSRLWCCHHDPVIARVHPVHATNAEQRQTAADLWTKPMDMSRIGPPVGCWETTSTIVIYYYSARKLILILPSQ